MDDTPKYYEYIVVGCGGIGSGTLYWLSKTTKTSILGLEQFSLGHDHGGSQDHSRIIRNLYTDQMYTRLTKHTFETWNEVERDSGVKLVHHCGCIDIARNGTPGLETQEKYAKAMDQQNKSYERWSAKELMMRFPQWKVSENTEALFDPEGGLVDAALGNSVHIQLAQANGAKVLDNCGVTKLEPQEDGFCLVKTTKGTFRCRRVIATAGAWINQILANVGVHIPVTVTQEQVTYLATPNVKQFTKEKFPVFIYHTPNGFDVYGMPSHVNSFFKIGIDAGGPAVLPDTRNYTPDIEREQYCMQWTQQNLPDAIGPLVYTKTCLYTMTPDRNFVIDTLAGKGMPQVVICCGAGHAYKWASFLGKVLSELAVTGQTTYNIDGFSLQRDAMQDPKFKNLFWRGEINAAKL